MDTSKRTLTHIEIIRIIAAFFVIFNHTDLEGYTLFTLYPPDSFQHWFYLFFSVICKISVPLFLMISGALLLKKKEEPVKKQIIRIVRIAAALLIFSLLAYIQQILSLHDSFDLLHFFRVLFEDCWMSPYWYLYLYLAFLVCLPFLRRLANAMTDKLFLYMIALVIVLTGLLPVLFPLLFDQPFVLSPSFSIGWIATFIVFYPLLGFYLENRLDLNKVTGKFLALLWVAALAAVALTCLVTSKYSAGPGQMDESYMDLLVPVYAAPVYLSFRKLLNLHPAKEKTAAFLGTVGACTFGIYLFHGFILFHPKLSLVHLFSDKLPMIPLTCGLLRCLEVMIASFVITWLLKKIPGVRKLL